MPRDSLNRFYDKETNSAAFCVVQQMSYQISLSFYATQKINHFLNSISANHKRDTVSLYNLEDKQKPPNHQCIQ